MADIGDLVNFIDDERLDKPDALALQSLVYAAMARVVGGLCGPCSGALSYVGVDSSVPASTTVSACLLLHSEIDADGDYLSTAYLLHHDPDNANQTSVVNASGFTAGVDFPYLWARRITVDMDNASRKVWDAGIGDETSTPVNTRKRERVEWGVGLVAPGGTGWFAAAKVISWSGSIPIWRPWHPWDQFEPTAGNDKFATASYVMAATMIEDVQGEGFAGLAHLFRHVILQLKRINGVLANVPWRYTPARGLYEINDDLTALENTNPNLIPLSAARPGNGSTNWVWETVGIWKCDDVGEQLLLDCVLSHANVVPAAHTKAIEIGVSPGSLAGLTATLWSYTIGVAPGTPTLKNEGSVSWAAGGTYDEKTISVLGADTGNKRFYLEFVTTGAGAGTDAQIWYARDVSGDPT